MVTENLDIEAMVVVREKTPVSPAEVGDMSTQNGDRDFGARSSGVEHVFPTIRNRRWPLGINIYPLIC